MLTQEATPLMIEDWKRTWGVYREKLRPGRKSGREILEYLRAKYPLTAQNGERAKQVVIGNVLNNAPFSARLPAGVSPEAAAFLVEDKEAGHDLYAHQDAIFKGCPIFVGVELQTGYFCVEGSSLLWDTLCAFRGLDEEDLGNFYSVAEYVSCLKRFGLLEGAMR